MTTRTDSATLQTSSPATRRRSNEAVAAVVAAALAMLSGCAAEVPEPCGRADRREVSVDYWAQCIESGHDRESCKSATICIRYVDDLDGAACDDVVAVCCARYGACAEETP